MEDCRVLQLGAHPWNFQEHHLQSPPFAMAVLVLLPMIWCFFWPVSWISSVHVPVSPESCTCSYAVPSVFNISAWGWLRNGLFMLTKTYKNSGWVKKITGTTCFVFTIFILSPNFHQGASVRTSVAASNLGAASWCSFTFTCSAISWLRNGIPDSSMDSETADGLEMV